MSKLVKFIFAINLESVKLLEIKIESFSKKDLKKDNANKINCI